MNVLIDSNILIYASEPTGGQVRNFIRTNTIFVSAISQVEVLGYHKLGGIERQLLESFFALATIIPITQPIVGEAIRLRCIRKMSLGDSLVAATALLHNLTLATHNTSDFSWINGIMLFDPV
ncbi:MAG: type II toxin-antitoxin system VapC family toxin [Blastocatellia bacterium]